MIFLGSKFQVHKPSVFLVAVLINSVKKQVLQVSYKTVAGDLISFHSFGSIVNLFIYDLLSYMILFGTYFKFQNFSHACSCSHQFRCEKSSIKSSSNLLMGIWSQFPLMRLLIFYFVNHQIFLNLYKIMELNHSLSTIPGLLYLWSHAQLLTELVKRNILCICMDTCS